MGSMGMFLLVNLAPLAPLLDCNENFEQLFSHGWTKGMGGLLVIIHDSIHG